MKTDDLIAALAADNLADTSPLERTIAIAALIGALIAGVAFLLSLGARPDIEAAIATIRFPFKFVVTLVLTVTAALLLVRLAKPGAFAVRQWRSMWAAPALILGGVLIEMLVLPASVWRDNILGSNALMCLAAIPLLSIGPLAALLFALKRGAPVQPRLAGAVCGLLSASVAATLYALHCTDDSPLFVVVWYSLAIGAVTVVAAGLGGRLLRW